MDQYSRSRPGILLTDDAQERLLKERIIVLGDEIDDETANRITMTGVSGVGGSGNAPQNVLRDKWIREMAVVTSEATGQSVAQVIKDSDGKRWFTASEAVDYGLVDEVVDQA
ncbi:MAG: ATP-dependent Clp protease proteolytic subunit ClpP [Amycolatopsis sp.]|uniref:ATP-dependent Clp protease proteolytic subunit n=1 Tax=Amycolatopsis sp. TaxID=37632 RepID=UPI00261998AF|nr:ATP-dependent Clp protease proteolytic subunit [Amycolatopsis sp.]MCU1681993.1 ATP-dependent Clp protease proteolytic subunit ClpP [Amycolatopsis sp.]